MGTFGNLDTMPRPRGPRRIEMIYGLHRFKPQGIPARDLEEIILTRDELEAIRLSDLEGMYQDQAAERMGISRATFGRIVTEAHHKVADALVNAKMLRIGEEPGPFCQWRLICRTCGNQWEEKQPQMDSTTCPSCGENQTEMWTPRRPGRQGRGGRPGREFRGQWQETLDLEKQKEENRENHGNQ